MPERTETPQVLPLPDPETLLPRVLSICGALGADRVGIARRLVATQPSRPGPFEVILCVDAMGRRLSSERSVPLSGFLRLMQDGRILELQRDASDPLARWLRRENASMLLGWPLPDDRRPAVFLLAVYESARRVGEQRLEVALAGMEAVARSLAPPSWLPLASVPHEEPREVGGEEAEASVLRSDLLPLHEAVALVERVMLRRALRCAEGNKAAAARRLRVSRQGLYKKLRQHGLL